MNESPEGDVPVPIGRGYHSGLPCRYHVELLPLLMNCLRSLPTGTRILDAGCGNGILSGELFKRGFCVCGIDVSPSSIEICRRLYPEGQFHIASASDPDLPQTLGTPFDAIVASEVIEHLYSPAKFFINCQRLLKPGGLLVLSTPYHGYLKHLLLALAGKLDAHLQVDHEGGHIKFWSRKSLTNALAAHGFKVTAFAGCGRIPFLWKSMVIKAEKGGLEGFSSMRDCR